MMGRVLGAMAVGLGYPSRLGYPAIGSATRFVAHDVVGNSPLFWLRTLMLLVLFAVQHRQLQPLPAGDEGFIPWRDILAESGA